MARSRSARLQELIHRRDKVLAVLHPPSAAHARIMEKAGCEALFVGTGGVVGAYTGLADVGTATMTECVTIAGWIADSVSIPVIMDGDTGHGGIMAVRRLVRECIRAGHGRHPHRRPADRGQAQDPECRDRGRAARPGDRPLPRRGRHEERARPGFCRDGAVLCPRCRRRHARRHDRALEGLSRGGRGRLGAVRIAAFGGRDQGGARRGRRARFRL